MITPIREMTINQIMKRKDDLLVAGDDINEIADNVREKTIDNVFDFLKKQRDKKYMKVNFDDLEIKKYKEQLKSKTKL